MAGSPKKRARRLAAQGVGGARARAKQRQKPHCRHTLSELADLARAAVTPVPPDRVPCDAELVRIAKGVLLAIARHGEPQDQVRAAWQLGDLAGARRAQPLPAQGGPTPPAWEAEAQAAQAALGGTVQ
jgi:hypothetical protein